MPRRDVQRLEVEPLGLDLGSELDLVPKGFEHSFDLAAHLGQDVDVATAQRLAGEGRRVDHAANLRRISKRIRAAAAATFKDSMPSVSGTVTSARSGRDRPCASLPRTIMPADSIGASASGAPLDAAAPKP